MPFLTRMFLAAATFAWAQAQTPAPDQIVFTNGDKLAGHFVSATGTSVTFKSDILGNVTVDWAKVKELHTTAKVAVIRKGVKLRKHQSTADIPQGTLAETEQKLQLTPATGPAAQPIPVGDASVVVDQAAFTKAMTMSPGFFSDWKGTVTAGATLVQATQDSYTFHGALNLVRAEPTETWLDARYRTIVNFSDSFGEVTQPATPTVKTAIFHAGLEQDEYFSTALYGFGDGAFDHNFSQGLDLQQTYAGGIGWTIIKKPNQTLDLKAGISYIRQQFSKGPAKDLAGSVFAEHYNRKFAHGLTLDQTASVTPAWNNTAAYSAAFGAALTLPVYKRLGATTGVIDTFLNDPPAGFKKNSFEYTLGLTYTIQ